MAPCSGTGRRVGIATLAAATILLLATSSTASAEPSGDPAPSAIRAIAGAATTEIADGLYEVDPEIGAPLTTHGPDTRLAVGVRGLGLAAGGTGFSDGAIERPPLCASDYYQRVVYARTESAPDRFGEAVPEIRSAVGRMNAVLDAASVASGGPSADYKVLCDDLGQVRVDSLLVAGTTFADVVSAARAAGYTSDQASLLVFVDGSAGASCGIASYEADERLAIDNRSNSGGGVALVYEPCWRTEAVMHESAHLMGAVQYSAPNSTGTGGHCNEGADVLCYSPDGGDLNQNGMLFNCPGAAQFDCNFDDYFDSAPEAGEYLTSHWNLGSPLNRFISLAARTAPGPTAQVAPGSRTVRRGKRRGASGEAGTWQHFTVRVPRRARSLKVRLLAGPGADLGLYLRHHRKATDEIFACRELLRSRHAACRLDDPRPGRWDAGVLTRGGAIGVSFRVRARARQ